MMKNINITKIAKFIYFTLTAIVLLWIIYWFIVHPEFNFFKLSRTEFRKLGIIPKMYGYIYLGICILCAIPMSFSKK